MLHRAALSGAGCHRQHAVDALQVEEHRQDLFCGQEQEQAVVQVVNEVFQQSGVVQDERDQQQVNGLPELRQVVQGHRVREKGHSGQVVALDRGGAHRF